MVCGYLPSRRTSLPYDGYIKLQCLVTRGICVRTGRPRLLLSSGTAEQQPAVELMATSRVAGQRPNCYTTQYKELYYKMCHVYTYLYFTQ